MLSVEGAIRVEVPALLARSAHRSGELQFVGSIENHFVVGSDFALDFNPSTIINTEVSFDANRFVWISRIAFEKHVRNTVFDDR